MKVRLCTKNDINSLVNVVNYFDSIYGIELDSYGIREGHIRNFHRVLENTSNDANIVAAFDDDNNILGYCLQTFATNKPVWFIINCYILPINKDVNQYNASKIGGKLVEFMVNLAEERNIFEFYYVVRDIKNVRLSMTLNATDTVKEKYNIDDIEYIPPLTESKFYFVREYIMALTNGKNRKSLILRKGYLKK
jgi:myo-inositol-1-phosphate synthase